MTRASSRTESRTSSQIWPQTWKRIFVDHPQSVDESYFEHLRFAGWFASRLFAAGGAALVHALIPCLFEKTAGRMVHQMHDRLTRRS
ncbi:MAG: DUF6356 family protein [Pseudomonadota bacterium]